MKELRERTIGNKARDSYVSPGPDGEDDYDEEGEYRDGKAGPWHRVCPRLWRVCTSTLVHFEQAVRGRATVRPGRRMWRGVYGYTGTL